MSDFISGPVAFNRRQATQNRLIAVQVHVVRASGTVKTTGAGEGLVDVKFPNEYIEKPALSFGGELDAGQTLTAGAFPTISIIVAKWLMNKKPNNSYFAGATLAIVTTGPADQVVITHWQAEGKAMSNPGDAASPANSTGNA